MTDRELSRILATSRAVLFDFDGPICSVFAGRPAPEVAARLRQLLPLGPARTDVSLDHDPLEVLRYAETLGAAVVARVEAALINEETEAIRVAVPTRGGKVSVKSCLVSGRRAALVTNNSERAARGYLEQNSMTQLFHVVVGRPALRPQRMKPHPGVVLAALARLSVQPAGAVLVGDSMSDIEAGRAAGTYIVGYASRPEKRASLAGADVVIDDMTCLATALITTPARTPK